MHFLHIAPFVQFTFLKHTRYVARDDGLVPSKKLGNLCLRHPKRFALAANVEAKTLIGAIDKEAIPTGWVLDQMNWIILAVFHSRMLIMGAYAFDKPR